MSSLAEVRETEWGASENIKVCRNVKWRGEGRGCCRRYNRAVLITRNRMRLSITARQSHYFVQFTLITWRCVKLPWIRMYLVRSTLPKICLNFLRRILFSVAVFVFLTLLERRKIQTSSALTFYKSAFSQLSVIFVLFMYDTKKILGRRTSNVVIKNIFAKWPLTRNSINSVLLVSNAVMCAEDVMYCTLYSYAAWTCVKIFQCLFRYSI